MKQVDRAALYMFLCNFIAMMLSIIGMLAIAFKPELEGASIPMLVLVQNGVGASVLTPIISILIIKLAGDPFNGFTMVEMGLMAGFSLFGKNVLNIWPIILGTWLYARYQKEPFAKYASVGLLATSLAPLVSYMALGSIHASIPLGILTGVIIGFVLPSLSASTYTRILYTSDAADE